MHGSFGGGGGPSRPRKSKNEVQEYEVTLEELYKGKTTRFASTKNVICTKCNGSGGKEKAKAKKCGTCEGRGECRSQNVDSELILYRRHKDCSTTCGSWTCDARDCKLLNVQWTRIILFRQGQVQEVRRETDGIAKENSGALRSSRCTRRRKDCPCWRSRPSTGSRTRRHHFPPFRSSA